MIVLATDAPLSDRNLTRLARRALAGLARTGAAFSDGSRDDAMTAAEEGADYVLFGEPDKDGERPSFDAIMERVEWWAELFQVPCVAFAASADEVAPLAAAGAHEFYCGLTPPGWDAAAGRPV